MALPPPPPQGDFVGWGGLGPVAVLLEYVFGIRAVAAEDKIVWDVRLTDRHGVVRYPFGARGVVDLVVAARASVEDEPVVTVTSNVPVRLVLRWGKGATAVGGVRPDRSGVPREPLHERVVAILPAA